jgi:exonuclease III
LRILSWNIQQGGGQRADRIATAVIRYDADVVVLSEFRNNDAGLLLRTRLLLTGYGCQVVTNADGRVNSVLIASRRSGGSELFEDRLEQYQHSMAQLETEGLDVIGMYLPHKKKHRCFDLLLEMARDERPRALVGDFNSGFNGIDQKGSSFWYSDRLEALREQGYVDAFRHVHGDAEEYSWFSHGGNGYRYDHTWVSPALAGRIDNCFYRHDEREAGLSDHSPMVLDLSDSR